ncbi:MAG: 2-hydroxyglutaryl-CoA dehydratase, partial [Clostridiales bacterium]|nr:2-hydroxyglutaryl-CoA dehydratase [Clostridiales bacterium]
MAKLKRGKNGRIIFTKEMKKDYTILVPDMLPIHFAIMRQVFLDEGYHLELLDTAKEEMKQLGLRYVHNDTCYPAILVIGQFLDA